MKKIIFILLFVANITIVHANESKDITADAQIKYKWYREEIVEGIYYPKKDILEGYLEDSTNVIIAPYYTVWDEKYCNYSQENYYIEQKKDYIYRVLQNTRYIKLENINYEKINNIRIFFKNNELEYEVIEKNDNEIKIDLKEIYDSSKLWFAIDAESSYDIGLSKTLDAKTLILSKHITKDKILIPDKSWIVKNTNKSILYTDERLEENDFTELKSVNYVCRVKEKKSYRYKVNRVYYDNNYYTYVENYIPDKEDYIIEYTKELPIEIIEITQLVKDKEIQKEYIYINDFENINSEEKIETQDSSIIDQNSIIETKYIENEIIKKVYKIPKKIYLIIAILLIIIIVEIIKRKRSEKRFS